MHASNPSYPARLGRFFLRWSRRTLIVVAILGVLLVAARVAAPHVLRGAINRRLAQVEGYRGSVGDIDLHLWRGAYQLEKVSIERSVAEAFEPFFSAGKIDFSLAWRELLHGRILSDIDAQQVELTIVPTPKKTSSTEIEADPWQQVIEDIFPIDITRFTLNGGRLTYRDDRSDPPVDIALEQLALTATGLRNRPAQTGEPFPAKIELGGTTVGAGVVQLHVELDPLAPRPHFDLDAQIEGVHLPALNDYLKAYGNVDVSRGTFKAYMEMAAEDGRFEGYVKPFFDDISFKDLGESDKNFAERFWESLVSGLVKLFKNKPRDQLGTRIPFSGQFDDPKVGLWSTFANLFRHGFIRALTERLEGSAGPRIGEKVEAGKAAEVPAR